MYTERAEMVAVSCGTSHASAVSTDTTSVDIQKTRYKKLVTHAESQASAASLLESGEQLYKKAINNNNNYRGHSLVQTSFTEPPNIRCFAEAHNGNWETDRV